MHECTSLDPPVSWLINQRNSHAAYHEVDGRTTTKNVSRWNDGTTTRQPLGRTRVVEGCSLAVQLHVTWEDTRTEHPWVVEVALASLNKQHLELVVQIGQTASNDATRVKSANEVNVLVYRNTHPHDPPPHTMISTSSGIVILTASLSLGLLSCLVVIVVDVLKWWWWWWGDRGVRS